MSKKPIISNDDQMTLMSSKVGDIYQKMAQDLMLQIIKRIKERGTADLEREPWLWQLEKLNSMYMLNDQNIKYIQKQTGIARKLLNKIIKNEGLKVYQNTYQQLAEQLNVENNPSDVKQALESYVNQAFLDLDNYVNQTLLSSNFGNNTVMKMYKSIIEELVAKVAGGIMTADQAIAETIMQWVDRGVPSFFVDAAGRRWNIDTYARMIIDSTIFRVYNDMRTKASEELGVDTFYYSIHAASRPACAPIQAKVITKGSGFYSEELGYHVDSLSAHGWGTPGGCLGNRCKHYLTPFIIGVNELPELPNQLKNLTEEQAIENGKKQARQRAYERSIRDNKFKLEAAKAIEDIKLIEKYRNLLANNRVGLKALLKENDFLFRDYVREQKNKVG